MTLVKPLGSALLIAMMSAAGSLGEAVEIRATSLSIGETWTTVRELRVIRLKRGVHELVLAGIPRSADVSSLVRRSRRIPLHMLEWSRVEEPLAGLDKAYVLDGDDVRWRPGAASLKQDEVPGSDAVRCMVESPVDISRLGVDVLYRLRGISWSAHYQILVRGERREEQGPVSVDLLGRVRLVNNTAHSFQDARISLIGSPEKPREKVDDRRGFLMLDRNDPLSDLWFDVPEKEDAEFDYRLKQAVTLEAGTTVDVPLIQAVRTPAERLYSIVAEDYPLGMKERKPLRKWIVFRHSPDRRRGLTLPPGDVEVFLGGLRQHRLQDAWFERTPPGSEIRIDLGLAADVTGVRRRLGRSTPIGGFLEEAYVIDVLNSRDTDIMVEIDEKPPVTLGWSLLSSTRPHRKVNQRLLFFPEVKAGARERVEYRLRIPQPKL